MLPQFSSSQSVQNAKTGDIGRIVAVVPSPYPNEEAAGISRVQVWTTVPGSDGQQYPMFDWWLINECIPVPNAAVPQGALAVIVNRDGQEETALVLATGYDEIAVMLGDGETIWIALSTVIRITTACVPLTNRDSKSA